MLNTLQILNSTEYKMFSYTGSKQKFQSQFHDVIEKMSYGDEINVKYYIEGFSGSLMSLFLNLQKVQCEYIVINDFNSKLINLYVQIQKNPKLVIEGYKMIEEKFNSLIPTNSPKVRVYQKDKRDEIRKVEEFYKYIRNLVNTTELDWCHSSLMLFVLNHNFNGMYSENKKGHINISFNWSTLPVKVERIEKSLYNLSDFFNSHKVIFECMDIDSLVSKYNNHDTFIYLDPPYINSKIQYINKRVKENSFELLDTHKKLLNSLNKYKYVMYSNNHHDEFISMCDGFVNFERNNDISGKSSKKSKKEILSFKVNHKISVNNENYKKYLPVVYIPKQEVNNHDYSPEDYSISIGTCFSGLGCPEYVLKKLNVPHTSEFVCDIDKYCRETLVRNYNPKQVFEDITQLSVDKLPNKKLDLYVFGSPCQDVSQSNNNRSGLMGEKSSLFFEGYRILKELRPKFSIFENVIGLLSSNNGEDFKTVLKLFNDLGDYDVYWKKINPIDIGGRTNRVRVFVVLVRKDVGIEFNFPKNVKSTKCIKDCLIPGDYKYLDKSEYIPWKRPIEKQTGKLKKDFFILHGSRHEQKRVFNINYPSPTIQRSGVVHINDGKGVRLMSPKELQNVQGLNDLDMSHLSKTQQLSQLGNTMEYETMRFLIGEIVRIDKLHKSKKQELLVS